MRRLCSPRRRPQEDSNRFPGHKTRRPDSFDRKSIAWTEYLTHFSLISRWNNWSDEEKAMQLAMSMTGDALAELSDLPNSVVADFDLLAMALSDRFELKERIMTFRCEFRQRKQKKGESPTEFSFALKKLISRAFPELDTKAKEILLIEQFMTGLGSLEVQRHVQLGHPKYLSQAVSLAEELEHLMLVIPIGSLYM